MNSRHIHKFILESVCHGRYVNYVEYANDPVEAVEQLHRRKPKATICIVNDKNLNAVYNMAYIVKNKEKLRIEYDLMN